MIDLNHVDYGSG